MSILVLNQVRNFFLQSISICILHKDIFDIFILLSSVPEDLDLPPIVHSVSRIDNKIIITYRTSDLDNETQKM